jgi:chaperonin cofactor prefoldin
MDDSISHLEEKVLQAVRLIKELRSENSQLQHQQEELQGQYEDLKEDNQRMNRELEEAKQAAASLERFEEKRRIIEEKVGGLLAKLEEIG